MKQNSTRWFFQHLPFNQYVTNGLFHSYQLGEFGFILGGPGVILFDDNHLSKQCSPRWDATCLGIIGLPLSHKGCKAYMG